MIKADVNLHPEVKFHPHWIIAFIVAVLYCYNFSSFVT